MKVLILHHVESMWAANMWSHRQVIYEHYLEQVKEHIDESEYDRVHLNMFEGYQLEPEHYPIAEDVTQVNTYGYGLTADMFDPEGGPGLGEGVDYCEGGVHSEVVELQDWMHGLLGHEVYIAGAFDGECIEDLEIALTYVGVDYSRVEALII